tara:strand:+ start:874 stop:1440 length:567 start_codon:yes stop_codon:yes gene_type:complete
MIILLANYRVGSSVFQRDYAKKTGATCWTSTGEYLHPFDGGYKPPDSKINLYKVMPDQYKDNSEDFKKDYLDKAREIIYLVRRDFTTQILSYAKCVETQNWHPWEENWNQRFDPYYQYSFELDKQTWREHKILLASNLEHQSRIYKSYPGKVMYLEDRYSKPIEYLNKVEIVNAADYYSNIDVEKYFQ